MSDESSSASSSSSSSERVKKQAMKKKKEKKREEKSSSADSDNEQLLISKKRKRNADASTQTTVSETQFTFEIPALGSAASGPASMAPPLIASFPMGPPPKSLLHAADAEERLQFRLFTNQKDISLDDDDKTDSPAPVSGSIFEDWSTRWAGKKSAVAGTETQTKQTELRVSATNHRIEYVGKDFGDTSIKNDVAKFAIGVLNKKTKTIRLLPAPGVYSMEQSIVGYEPRMPADLSHLSKLEQRRIRAKDVNNRRAQLSIERLISNALTDKNTFAMDSSVLNMMASDRENATEDGQPKSRADLPRYDLTADSPADIFQMEDIVPNEHLHLLNGETFRRALEDSKLIPKLESKFKDFSFAKTLCLYMTSAKGMKQRSSDRAQMLQYLYFMLVMYRVASKAKHNTIRYPDKDANSPVTHIPRQLVLEMLNEFTEIPSNQKNLDLPLYHFPKVKLDKLVNFICILSLSLHGYKIAINELAIDMDMTPRDLRQYFINFGCKTWYGTDSDDAEPEKKAAVEAETGDDDDAESKSKRRKLDSDGVKKEIIYAKLVAPLRLPVKRLIRRN